jgi:hypothetical protein
MPPNEAALGLRAHSGWTVAVAMAGGVPVLRRRIEMVTGTGVRARQPYHAAEGMKPVDAQAFLDRVRAAAVQLAAAGICGAISDLEGRGYRLRRGAVLLGSGKPLPELGKILAAHPLIHTAEGVFFRDILLTACRDCGLQTSGIRERDLPANLVTRTGAMGKFLGPPWTQDEKMSAAAALTMLE